MASATRTFDQQKSVRVDDAFLAACHNTGVNLHELDARTLDDFHDGPTPPASPSASTSQSQPSPPPASPRGRGPAIPKEILERRHKNYEALRLRKLHVVLVERDRLIRKGHFTDEGTATGSGDQGDHPMANEPTPVPPAPSRTPGSSLVAAPPTAVPKPPPQSQQQSTLSSRRGSNSFRRASNSRTTALSKSNIGSGSDSVRDNQKVVAAGVRVSKADIEPLNFEDGDRIAASSQSFSVSASLDAHKRAEAGDADVEDNKNNFREASYSSSSQRALSSSTTPRLPPCEGATTLSTTNRALLMTSGGGSNSNSYHKKSQKELIIENAYRQHKQRILLSRRLAQAHLLKGAKEEDQQRRAAEAQLRDMEEAKQRDERARLIHQANLQQAENRNRRDELLRQMREENARVEMEMGALELEAKTRELEDVRKKQMLLLEQKREQARQRNEKSMRSAREKQLLLSERQQANLERKGLLFELAGGNGNNSGRKSNHSPFQASASGDNSDEGYESAHKIANSELKRRLRRQAEEQRFEEKRQREAQRLATAAEIAEQTRLRALMTIQQKEMRSREHLTRETAARDHYMMSNVNTTMANIEKSKEARMRQEEEMRLYRDLLELERNETQEERDRRVFMESQLKNEDRMARDEWRRSVAERSKRYEALKQLDADMRSRAKQAAAEQRRREIQETIEAIKAGAVDLDHGAGGEEEFLGGAEAIRSM